ncbi:hypothetical protein D1159_05260 [Pseudoflavonifractor sp. 524-17]|nr:hypothetical protein [Pseudoflavonifractor sp. 524-17]NCE64009.1 hypothetical protein [Pseudoflavonifractor sp. 524-17]
MITLCLLLSACGGGSGGGQAEELALGIRAEYLAADRCAAQAEIIADYGQRVYQYALDVDWAREGVSTLTITAPEEVAGVTARLQTGETALEYDGVRVETGPLNPEGLSPMDAVPALFTAAREGFLAQCTLESTQEGLTVLHTVIRDPDAAPGAGTEVQLWFHGDTHALLRGEISQDGFTVIQCVFHQFVLTPAPA